MLESNTHERTESKKEQKAEYGGPRLPNKDVEGMGNKCLPKDSMKAPVFKAGKPG